MKKYAKRSFNLKGKYSIQQLIDNYKRRAFRHHHRLLSLKINLKIPSRSLKKRRFQNGSNKAQPFEQGLRPVEVSSSQLNRRLCLSKLMA